MSKGIDQLLSELKTTDSKTIIIGRLPAAAASAVEVIAAQHAHDLAVNPKYYAECGPIKMVIDWNEYAMLANHGAAKDAYAP